MARRGRTVVWLGAAVVLAAGGYVAVTQADRALDPRSPEAVARVPATPEPSRAAPTRRPWTAPRPAVAPTPTPVRRPASGRVRPVRVIDGDTVAFGELHVRLLGIDTPEIGECGFYEASSFAGRFLRTGGRISHRSGVDRYGRLLAYVLDPHGRDLGAAEIKRGLANARYDATDGYDVHPNQSRYRRLDAHVHHICGPAQDRIGGPESSSAD